MFKQEILTKGCRFTKLLIYILHSIANTHHQRNLHLSNGEFLMDFYLTVVKEKSSYANDFTLQEINCKWFRFTKLQIGTL